MLVLINDHGGSSVQHTLPCHRGLAFSSLRNILIPGRRSHITAASDFFVRSIFWMALMQKLARGLSSPHTLEYKTANVDLEGVIPKPNYHCLAWRSPS